MRRHLAHAALLTAAIASVATSQSASYTLGDETTAEVSVAVDTVRAWRVTLTAGADSFPAEAEQISAELTITGTLSAEIDAEVAIEVLTFDAANGQSVDEQFLEPSSDGGEVDLYALQDGTCEPGTECTWTFDVVLTHSFGEGAVSGTLDLAGLVHVEAPSALPSDASVVIEVRELTADE